MSEHINIVIKVEFNKEHDQAFLAGFRDLCAAPEVVSYRLHSGVTLPYTLGPFPPGGPSDSSSGLPGETEH